MNTIFSKKYSGKIKRVITEGQICPSSLPELHIKKTKEVEVDNTATEGLYPTKIFNILKKKDTTEITSNTLNLKITETVFDGKPYFKKFSKPLTNKDWLKGIKEEYYLDGNTLYINTDKTYYQVGKEIYTVIPTLGLNLWNKDPRVSIRRLKDRFKITVKTTKQLTIQLVSTSLLTPTVHDHWLTFTDCVHTFGTDSFLYLYTHSFEFYDKVEIHDRNLEINLRDIPISDVQVEEYLDTFYKISYKTFRSNLQINSELGDTLYINLEVKDNLVKLVSKNSVSPYIIKVLKRKTTIDNVDINPYLLTPLYTSRPETYYFTWETASKYSTDFNVPLGCERVELDLAKVLSRRVPVLNYNGDLIFESNYQESDEGLNTSLYSKNKEELEALKTALQVHGVII